ncbi:MAG: bis(5'-nucleosyl)-tetraphosphatase (symmetrical) YqeK [Eubacterium sp.]|nr:bis(5'-nucleosyl)-tetraphosphatase (symmetrical) YqeK [Eubacterium sp.]
MYNTEEYIKLIKERLSPYRFNHSMCVAEKARELAEKHGLDGDKAYVAGILHDVTKETDYAEQRRLIEHYEKMTDLEINNKKVYHQMSGAAFVQSELGITDSDIISGIRYHTTGREDMTLFEMIIYLADFTSADRDYPDVDIMREKTDNDLLDGMLYSLSYTVTSIVKQGRQIHPDTINCYNYCLSLKARN